MLPLGAGAQRRPVVLNWARADDGGRAPSWRGIMTSYLADAGGASLPVLYRYLVRDPPSPRDDRSGPATGDRGPRPRTSGVGAMISAGRAMPAGTANLTIQGTVLFPRRRDAVDAARPMV